MIAMLMPGTPYARIRSLMLRGTPMVVAAIGSRPVSTILTFASLAGASPGAEHESHIVAANVMWTEAPGFKG
jgi:hypothetical protein